jgi:hypothetical protein
MKRRYTLKDLPAIYELQALLRNDAESSGQDQR